MKKIFGVLALGTALLGSTALSGSAAFAGSSDDLVARLNAAEQENAAMRKKSAELAATPTAKPAGITDRMADFFGAYAADLPVAYKAPRPVEPGRLTVWGQGGAIWTGGDRVAQAFSLIDFTTVGFAGGNIDGVSGVRPAQGPISNSGSIPGIFDLDPKVGWTAATGFDYKFAESPWHVSGQVRYGESRNSGSAASAGTLDPSLQSLQPEDCFSPIADRVFPSDNTIFTACGGSQSRATTYNGKHWLTDLALGWDIVGGPSYVQVKGGLRISEFVATRTATVNQTNFANFAHPTPITDIGSNSPTFSSLSISQSGTFIDRTNFIGTGPVIGIEGSARFLGAWSFDYKGDLGLLFGTQNLFEQNIGRTTTTPAILGIVNNNFASGGFANAGSSASRFVTVLSPDIEVGLSYWFMPNVKVSGSYRIDGLIAVKNQKSADASNLLLPQRYWHGPLFGISGWF